MTEKSLELLLFESRGKLKNSTPEIAEAVIEELGGIHALARIFDVAPPSIQDWKKYGIPGWRQEYLKRAYPDLKAWSIK